MSKLLYIKANCKPENESRTFKISDRFIEEYKKSHPMDEIVVLDLYKEDIDFIRADDFKVIFQQELELMISPQLQQRDWIYQVKMWMQF